MVCATARRQQLSASLFDSLHPRLLALLPRSSLLDAAKHVGAHLAAATLARPAAALAAAVPQFSRALLHADALRPLSENQLVRRTRWSCSFALQPRQLSLGT